MEETAHHIGPGLREAFALINLLIVIAIIVMAAGKGIKAGIRARTDTISKKIVAAKAELERMNAETAEARRQISEIDGMKKKFLSEMRDEGQKLYESIVRDAKSTADRILADARAAGENEISNAAGKLREDLIQRALSETLEMAKGSNELKQKIHDRLVERFLQSPQKEGAGA
jgi:F0F1-type ATP synthase membrane subunit b/b'